MKLIVAVVLLTICIVMAFVFLKSFLISAKQTVKNLPKGLKMIFFIIVIIVFIVALSIILKEGKRYGWSWTAISYDQNNKKNEETNAGKDCIRLDEDIIIIDGESISIDDAEKHIEELSKNRTSVTIVDYYSEANLMKSIVDICDRKGVPYIIEEEN